jgi:signal transduction histidine kinase
VARGQRLDLKSDGAGLGLAIVSDIAEAWGGRR